MNLENSLLHNNTNSIKTRIKSCKASQTHPLILIGRFTPRFKNIESTLKISTNLKTKE